MIQKDAGQDHVTLRLEDRLHNFIIVAKPPLTVRVRSLTAAATATKEHCPDVRSNIIHNIQLRKPNLSETSGFWNQRRRHSKLITNSIYKQKTPQSLHLIFQMVRESALTHLHTARRKNSSSEASSAESEKAYCLHRRRKFSHRVRKTRIRETVLPLVPVVSSSRVLGAISAGTTGLESADRCRTGREAQESTLAAKKFSYE
ncbi:hypothetical protein ACU8KH_04451 [Lachancea thermotolerans]